MPKRDVVGGICQVDGVDSNGLGTGVVTQARDSIASLESMLCLRSNLNNHTEYLARDQGRRTALARALGRETLHLMSI